MLRAQGMRQEYKCKKEPEMRVYKDEQSGSTDEDKREPRWDMYAIERRRKQAKIVGAAKMRAKNPRFTPKEE